MLKAQLMNQDSGEKTWLTPKYIIDALGHFDTDPCVPPDMPWKTADMMLTAKEDGRVAPWNGRVWLNPPYGRDALPFLKRMSTHEGGGIALVFARTDTRQFHDLIFPAADSILFLKGRIKFCDRSGELKDAPPAPSVLVAYSPQDTLALERSGLDGFLMKFE